MHSSLPATTRLSMWMVIRDHRIFPPINLRVCWLFSWSRKLKNWALCPRTFFQKMMQFQLLVPWVLLQKVNISDLSSPDLASLSEKEIVHALQDANGRIHYLVKYDITKDPSGWSRCEKHKCKLCYEKGTRWDVSYYCISCGENFSFCTEGSYRRSGAKCITAVTYLKCFDFHINVNWCWFKFCYCILVAMSLTKNYLVLLRNFTEKLIFSTLQASQKL